MRRRDLVVVGLLVLLLGVAMAALTAANGFALARDDRQRLDAPGTLGTGDVVAKLRAKGLRASATGETVPPLFEARSGEVILVEGQAVQVYGFADAAAARQALVDATGGPGSRVVEWVARPHFVQTGSVLVTVVTDDEAFAAEVAAALR